MIYITYIYSTYIYLFAQNRHIMRALAHVPTLLLLKSSSCLKLYICGPRPITLASSRFSSSASSHHTKSFFIIKSSFSCPGQSPRAHSCPLTPSLCEALKTPSCHPRLDAFSGPYPHGALPSCFRGHHTIGSATA